MPAPQDAAPWIVSFCRTDDITPFGQGEQRRTAIRPEKSDMAPLLVPDLARHRAHCPDPIWGGRGKSVTIKKEGRPSGTLQDVSADGISAGDLHSGDGVQPAGALAPPLHRIARYALCLEWSDESFGKGSEEVSELAWKPSLPAVFFLRFTSYSTAGATLLDAGYRDLRFPACERTIQALAPMNLEQKMRTKIRETPLRLSGKEP
ncbi:hypothetical protein NliqN6_5947 [Naganishia liquefaciens]|uniref:Uncharacterized protein n=1 Tax=Naganishia liquefaciens TaxID=104408 RepID=A0A8H3YH38_9TREE|nr:hypothetical protein NliqN6_5947 [Naganishia liquefaciens]